MASQKISQYVGEKPSRRQSLEIGWRGKNWGNGGGALGEPKRRGEKRKGLHEISSQGRDFLSGEN